MRVGHRAFFYPGALKEALRAALSLAEFYRCSPYEFLDRDAEEIMNLHHESLVMIRERKVEQG
jgi:hypothetical protein